MDHSNMAHIGGMILSMARRIMNEVLDLANDLNIPVLYQDTDSMHIADTYQSDTFNVTNGLSLLSSSYENGLTLPIAFIMPSQ